MRLLVLGTLALAAALAGCGECGPTVESRFDAQAVLLVEPSAANWTAARQALAGLGFVDVTGSGLPVDMQRGNQTVLLQPTGPGDPQAGVRFEAQLDVGHTRGVGSAAEGEAYQHQQARWIDPILQATYRDFLARTGWNGTALPEANASTYIC
jgi:hypothetical protein